MNEPIKFSNGYRCMLDEIENYLLMYICNHACFLDINVRKIFILYQTLSISFIIFTISFIGHFICIFHFDYN